MKANNKRFSDRDVTDVCSLLKSVSPELVASEVLGSSKDESGSSSKRSKIVELGRRRVESLLKLALSLDPDLGSAPDPVIIPWSGRSLASLNHSSWPAILGRRVVVPVGSTDSQKAAYAGAILMNMSYL